MKDNTEEKETMHQSKLTFDEQVISKLVMMSIKEIDGVTTVKNSGGALFSRGATQGINVELGETEVAVDLRLILEFGKNAREIYDEIKKSIEDHIYNTTGLQVVEVNAKIEDVLNPSDFKSRIEA